jgi:multidrug efflux pump
LFNEFGVTLAGAVVVSSFVALTFTPMLCAKILRVPTSHGRVFQFLERGFNWLSDHYATGLAWAIRHRLIVVGGAFATILLAFWSFNSLKREFIPAEDRGWFMAFATAPEGSTPDYTDKYIRQIESIIDRTDGVDTYFAITGGFVPVNQGIVFANLEDWADRSQTTQEILGGVLPQLFGIPGVFAFAFTPSPVGGFGQPVQYVIKNPDADSLTVAKDRFLQRANQLAGLVRPDISPKVNKPELTIVYDRDRAEDLGVSVRDVGATLETMLGGRRVNTFTRQNKLYDVVVRMTPEDRATPADISDLYVRGRGGELINLDQVANVVEGVGPATLSHHDRVRSFTLSASLAPGFVLGEAIDSLDVVAAEVLPSGSSTALAGESREYRDSGNALLFAFVLALIVTYMVLAAQFESLVHPFTVLMAVPLAVTGALVTLQVAGSTLNVYSQIGMILLIGLSSKNSILLVEFANQLKARGKDTVEAIQEAGRIRLRPILMTAVSTVAGATPIALGISAGSESRIPLGLVIVGGITIATVLTLFLVPVVFVLLDSLHARLSRPATVALKPAPESP